MLELGLLALKLNGYPWKIPEKVRRMGVRFIRYVHGLVLGRTELPSLLKHVDAQ